MKDLKHDDNDDLAVGGSRQHILNSLSYSPSKLYCFSLNEHIVSYQPALLMRTDFILRTRIDRMIQNAFECGLFLKWDRDSQRKKERIIPFEPSYIATLQQYSFALILILGSGLTISSLIFFTELFIQRQVERNPHSAWSCSRRVIDGHRDFFIYLPEKLQVNEFTIGDYIKATRDHYIEPEFWENIEMDEKSVSASSRDSGYN